MIAQTESASPRASAPAYQLRVFLTEAQPLIWRRVKVPGNANLNWLHAILQLAMGWTNSHLHQFICGEHVYADPRAELNEFEDDPSVLDEGKAKLAQLLPKPGDGLVYEYDFGDSWEHIITFEKLLPAEPSSATTAVCLAGERACPPEDCGGVGGYEELLDILKHPKHPEHKAMKEWLGRPFDPELFDVQAANTWLRRLKWPRVSEAQLAKVLMARDHYHE